MGLCMQEDELKDVRKQGIEESTGTLCSSDPCAPTMELQQKCFPLDGHSTTLPLLQNGLWSGVACTEIPSHHFTKAVKKTDSAHLLDDQRHEGILSIPPPDSPFNPVSVGATPSMRSCKCVSFGSKRFRLLPENKKTFARWLSSGIIVYANIPLLSSIPKLIILRKYCFL
uniref:Uncharacterized protein n=1 Tax=Ditylenchus dipsaci TaxID=166011 RepID=A0A915D5G2_9BILA